MNINHLIIGSANKEVSANFYCLVLGYLRRNSFVDTGTGQEGIVLSRVLSPTLLIVPFIKERLPNPQHIAFEMNATSFAHILDQCIKLGIKIRSDAPLNSLDGDPKNHEELGIQYQHFYFCDPSNVNIEIMKRLE